MKKLVLPITLLLVINTFSQDLNEKTFDFWVGNWEVSWKKADGTTTKGRNNIIRILGNKVIQENFEDPSINYKGMSLSIYNPKSKIWNQTWVDSGGSHFNFVGDIIDKNPAFKTKIVEKDGKKTQQRMIFKEIQKDSFIWIWEGTNDGGENWKTFWKINYKRIK